MRGLILIAAIVTCAGCATVADTIARHQEQERFESCMQMTLGKFGDFKSQDARLKAAELCQPKTPPAP